MKLTEFLDIQQMFIEVQAGYIRASRHPTQPLLVYCYTEKAVYENHWTSTTRKCRGLVVDGSQEIVGWCMQKFFNANEHIDGRPYAPPLPIEPFETFPKIDGSMGTVFHYGGKWLAATKGGFRSEQAAWAQRWLDARDLSALPTDCTFVTEIVYPENRIVVDYGPLSSLVLLTVFGPDGAEHGPGDYHRQWSEMGGGIILPATPASLSKILFYAQRNRDVHGAAKKGTEAEGYVIRYEHGLRVKVKFTDYVHLHRTVTSLTERQIWELLRDGRTLDGLIEVLPPEYHAWVEKVSGELTARFRDRAAEMIRQLAASAVPWDPREFRKYAQDLPDEAALFALYDLLSQQAWKAAKPSAASPWKDRE